MNDNELFELCKNVYEATGWDADEYTLRHYLGGEIYDRKLFESDLDDDKKTRESYAPLYTSDYLLEKLPVGTAIKKNAQRDEGRNYIAFQIDTDYRENQYADTPLKALLKVTLELHKKGLLDAKDN